LRKTEENTEWTVSKKRKAEKTTKIKNTKKHKTKKDKQAGKVIYCINGVGWREERE